MFPRSPILALCLLCLLCTGCATQVPQADPERAARSSTPAFQTHAFRFDDGGSALYFVVDKGVTPVLPPQTLVFVVPGSDCISMAPLLPHYFDGLPAAAGPIRIFILHKRFIAPDSHDRHGCGRSFVDADHPSRWLADQLEFARAQLKMAQDNSQPPARMVALGISEGGEVAPLLARRLNGFTHVAILANGGMNPADSFRLQAQRHGFAAQAAAVETACAAGEAGTYAAGRSCRYWSELLALDHTGNLLALSVPILVAMGEDDAMVPADSARFLAGRFAAAGKTNLTVLLFPGADHALARNKQSFLAYLWEAFDQWLVE
jgi:pimeloyl-ACP methyl ester carboxylesterase